MHLMRLLASGFDNLVLFQRIHHFVPTGFTSVINLNQGAPHAVSAYVAALFKLPTVRHATKSLRPSNVSGSVNVHGRKAAGLVQTPIGAVPNFERT